MQRLASDAEVAGPGLVDGQRADQEQPGAPRRVQQSGLGVENGMEGLLEYTVVQTLSVKRAG